MIDIYGVNTLGPAPDARDTAGMQKGVSSGCSSTRWGLAGCTLGALQSSEGDNVSNVTEVA